MLGVISFCFMWDAELIPKQAEVCERDCSEIKESVKYTKDMLDPRFLSLYVIQIFTFCDFKQNACM